MISSGYGLNESFKKNGCDTYRYWLTKTVRVIFPYLLICCFVAVVSNFCPMIGSPNWNNWYLFYLLKCYVVFFALAKIPVLYRNRYICLIIMALLVLAFSNELEAEQCLSFLMGIWISDHKEISEKWLDQVWVMAMLLLVGISFLALKQVGFVREFAGTSFYYVIQAGIKLPIGLFLIAVTYKFGKVFFNKVTAFFGKASYEIYLVQAQAFWILSDNCLSLVPFFAFVMGFTWLFYVIDENIKTVVLKKMEHGS